MKVFLTWYAEPPDPYYWLWIRNLDGLLLKISSMSRRSLDSSCLYGLKRMLGVKSTLIVDSLSSSLSLNPMSMSETLQSWVLYVEKLLGADLLVHRDIPLVNGDLSPVLREKLLERTILNAEHALKTSKKYGLNVILVAQGWNTESYVTCARKYLEMGARYIGLGSLVPRRNDPRFLEKVVEAVRRTVGEDTYLHVFGVVTPRSIIRFSKYVDSVDVSTPMRAAIAREVFVEKDNKLKRIHISMIGENIYSMMRDFDVDLAEKSKKSGTSREFVRYLAVYNAYVLLEWIRRQGL